MGVRLTLKPWFAASWHASHFPADRNPDDSGPRLAQTLHFALAAIVIVGWALVYTTLMRGIARGDLVRHDRGTAVSTNVSPRQTPSLPATPAALRQ